VATNVSVPPAKNESGQSLAEMVAVVEVKATLYLVAPSAPVSLGPLLLRFQKTEWFCSGSRKQSDWRRVMTGQVLRGTWETTRFAHRMEGVVVQASVLGWSGCRGLKRAALAAGLLCMPADIIAKRWS